MRRVVVTGMGIVSPVGTGVEYAWKNILNGVSGVRAIDTFDTTDMASKIAGIPVRGEKPGDFNPDSVVEPREQRKMDRAIIYGMVAADEAMRDANLIDYDGDKDLFGVSIGEILDGTSRKSPNYLMTDFNSLLKNCPTEKIDLIYKVAKTIAEN